MTPESIPKDLSKHTNFVNFDIDQLVHGFDRPPQIPQRAKRHIEQHEQFFAVAFDPDTGRILKRVSSSLRHAKRKLSEAIVPVFQSILDELPAHNIDSGDLTTIRRTYGLDSDKLIALNTSRAPLTLLPSQRPNKKFKREAAKVFDEDNQAWARTSHTNQIAASEGPERKPRLTIRLDAAQEWENWFADAFRAIQQLSCRIIAKEWIKTIQPKKQSTHPYNGKVLTSSDPADPDATKPPYWPKDVIHKEPDHINKDQRTKLLVHLLMNTPQKEIHTTSDPPRVERLIDAQALKDSLDKRSDELKGKWSIIEQIINVRTELERLNDGGRDGWDLIDVPDFRETNRVNSSKANDLPDETQDEVDRWKPLKDHNTDMTCNDGFGLKEERSLTPISSLGHASVAQMDCGLHLVSSDTVATQTLAYQQDNDLHLIEPKPSTHSFRNNSRTMQRDQRESQIVQHGMEIDGPSYNRDLAIQQTRLATVTLPEDFDHGDLSTGHFNSHQIHDWQGRQLALQGLHQYDPPSASADLSQQQENVRHVHPSQLPPSYFFETNTCGNCDQGNVGQRSSPQHFLTDQFGNYLVNVHYGQSIFHTNLAVGSSHSGGHNSHQAIIPITTSSNKNSGLFPGENTSGM